MINNKELDITIISKNDGCLDILSPEECDCICKKAGYITPDEYERAINIIIAKMCSNKLHTICVDIENRESTYKPYKEMTISDIEKELGYKIKIVKE